MSRRRLRRRALAWSGPVVIVLLVAAFRLLSLGPINASAQGLIDDGSYGDAVDRFGLLGPLTFVETWVEPFNTGVAHHGSDDFEAAEADFRVALDRVPASRSCPVRHNLAISIEAQGDAAADQDEAADARELWTEALAIVTTGGCIDADSEPGDRLREDERRLNEKLNPDGGEDDPDSEPDDEQGEGEAPSPPEQDPQTQTNLERLERRSSGAVEQERQDSTFDRLDVDHRGGERW